MEGPEMRRKRANAAYALTFGALRRQSEGDRSPPRHFTPEGTMHAVRSAGRLTAKLVSAGLSFVVALGVLSTPMHAQQGTLRKVIPRAREPHDEALRLDDGADDDRAPLAAAERARRARRGVRYRSEAALRRLHPGARVACAGDVPRARRRLAPRRQGGALRRGEQGRAMDDGRIHRDLDELSAAPRGRPDRAGRGRRARGRRRPAATADMGRRSGSHGARRPLGGRAPRRGARHGRRRSSAAKAARPVIGTIILDSAALDVES